MNATLEDLKIAAAALPLKERGALANFLIRTLDEGIDEKEAAAVRAEWLAVAERRMEEVKSGKVKGIPAEEVLRSLREQRP